MDLRTKTLVIFGVGILIVLAGFILFSSLTLENSYETIEKQEVSNDIQRVQYAIGVELANLDSTLVDWSQWDETYDFAQGNNSGYIEENLIKDTFGYLNWNLLFIFNQSGELVYAQVYDASTDEFVDVPTDLYRVIQQDFPLFVFENPDKDSSVNGILSYDDTPVLVAIRPILRNSGEGPAKGTMILGRNFIGNIDEQVSKSTGVGVTLVEPVQFDEDPSYILLRDQFNAGEPVVVSARDPDTVMGFTLFPELNTTESNYLLEITGPRVIYQTGLSTMYSFLTIVLVAGLISGLVGLLLIDRIVLSRISRITSEVNNIRSSVENVRIAELPGNDELTHLSRAINQMLEKITHIQQRYRSIVEDQTELICRFTPDGLITFTNPAFVRNVLDFKDNKANKSFYDLLPPEAVHSMPQDFFTTFSPQSPIKTGEQKYTIDGEEFWISWTIRGIFSPEGMLEEFQFVGRDISKERQITTRLREYQDHLEELVKQRTHSLLAAQEELRKAERLEAIGILAGHIAHDFNNLLLTILGNIEILEQEVESDSPIVPRLKELEKETLRARSLTAQMLTFSRGGAPIKKTINIISLIEETATFVSRGSKVKCAFSLEPDVYSVYADPDQINQVITNIVLNAIQAMPAGGIIRIHVENAWLKEHEIHQLKSGWYVKIRITDQGAGIPADQIDQIFEPFFTTKESGGGLGLASSRSIIEKHEGAITVESEIGKGSTFTIYLPAIKSLVADALIPESTPVQEYPVESGAGRILIMDDEVEILRMLSRMLQMKGYDVATAKDGIEAIELYKQAKTTGSPFDVVILDLTVQGGMGGGEAIKILREFDPGIKAIVSSGYYTDPIMADYKKYGFRGVLPKPFPFRELHKLLMRFMQEDQ